MKIYSIIITIIALCALGLAGFLYWQSGALRNDFGICQYERDQLRTDKNKLEGDLSAANNQLGVIRHSSAALNSVLNSFMYAGDIKAQAVGSKEAVKVEAAINEIDDSMDKMNFENSWNQFKETRLFNPLFGVLRGLANNIEKNLNQPAGNMPPINK